MEQGVPHSLINPGDHFDSDAQILGQPKRRLELLKSLENRNLSPQATQIFAFPTALAIHIISTSAHDLEGATENTLVSSQGVGRTTKNRVSSCNHRPLLAYLGYETPSLPKSDWSSGSD